MALGCRPVLIVDATPILVWYLSIADYAPRMTPAGVPCGGIVGTLLTLRRLCEQWSPHRIVLVYDAWGSTRRHRLFPGYKTARREKEADDPVRQWVRQQTREQANALTESTLLAPLGVQSVIAHGHEADDVVAYLARQVKDRPCVVVGEDKDLLQLVDENIVVYRPRKTDTVDLRSFRDVTSRFTPYDHLLSLAVAGDASDGIPGVRGVGAVTVDSVFAHKSFPTAEALRAYCAQSDVPRVRSIAASWETVERNLELIDLSRDTFTDEESARLGAVLTQPVSHQEIASYHAARPFLTSEVRSASSVLLPLRCLGR
ncbi:MAG: hypothetical protein IPH13_20590 [Planctomycetes bacterium]|nr:hypothetical protein [Planctomycetota bacterium]